MNKKKVTFNLLIALLFTSTVMAQNIETEGFLAIEMESTTSALGKWVKLQKPAAGQTADPRFIPTASGGEHLEFTGNTEASGPPTSPLEYTFKINTAGTYKLIVRASKRLEGAEGDKCNDCYIKMAGDFTASSDPKAPPIDILKTNEKFFGALPWPNWGQVETMEYHIGTQKKMGSPTYVFKAGQTYTLTFSGRSQRFQPDYFVLFNADKITLEQARLQKPGSTLVPIPEDPTCTSTYRYSSPWSFAIDASHPILGQIDEKGTQINVNTKIATNLNQWASAKIKFDKPAGTYNVYLTTLLEKTGQSYYRLYINNVIVFEFQNAASTVNKNYVVGVRNILIPANADIRVAFKTNRATGSLIDSEAAWSKLMIGDCSSLTVDKWVEGVSSVSETNINNAIEVYPNPVTDVLNIEHNQDATIRIFDLRGALLYNEKTSGRKTSIDVTKFKNSKILLLNVLSDNNSEFVKIIVE